MRKFTASGSKYKIVFMRHGESLWNKENRFTGWYDVPLTENGLAEAKKAGRTLKDNGYMFDLAYTSVLSRAIETYNAAAQSLGCSSIPIQRSWRLNERNYGALTGLNKSETAEKHGEEQVKVWRRSFDIPPPELDLDSPNFPGNDIKYEMIPRDLLPRTESLKTTIERVLPYWADTICPSIYYGRQVIVVAHGNSIRSIVKFLDKMSEKDIIDVNIPTAIPLVYELDKYFNPTAKYYLGKASFS
jgi:2,3-bisphosphoglycerate-dependent phosphoglycerate mutase